MDVTRRVKLNRPLGIFSTTPQQLGPNRFANRPAYPVANDRDVVRQNFDTLYSVAWLDLSKGPVVVSAGDTGGRYFLLEMIDMWTNAFAVPGTRTTGDKGGAWAVVPPGWNGTLPKGVERIQSPTPWVWITGRTQTNGPSDYAAVHKIQDGYGITPLAQWGDKGYRPPLFTPDPAVHTMPPEQFFTYAAELLSANPPLPTDWSQLQRIRRLGIEPGKPFDFAKASPEVQAALKRGPAVGLAQMKKLLPLVGPIKNGWQVSTTNIGVYGIDYLKRAIVAQAGLGANQPQDAVYPILVMDAAGKPAVSPGKYTLTFKKGETPPVGAFWSLTMYDGEGFQVANPINRFAIGSKDALKAAPDGSVTIYMQHNSPGPDKESNWLPAPANGPIGATLRLYAPSAAVLNGQWVPPPVVKAA